MWNHKYLLQCSYGQTILQVGPSTLAQSSIDCTSGWHLDIRLRRSIWELTQKPAQPQSEPWRWRQDRKRQGTWWRKHRLCYSQRVELKTPWNWAKELTHEKGQSSRRKGLLVSQHSDIWSQVILCGGALGCLNSIPDRYPPGASSTCPHLFWTINNIQGLGRQLSCRASVQCAGDPRAYHLRTTVV